MNNNNDNNDDDDDDHNNNNNNNNNNYKSCNANSYLNRCFLTSLRPLTEFGMIAFLIN